MITIHNCLITDYMLRLIQIKPTSGPYAAMQACYGCDGHHNEKSMAAGNTPDKSQDKSSKSNFQKLAGIPKCGSVM